jgi:hypothetical protein
MKYARILILLVIWNLLSSCFLPPLPMSSVHTAKIDKINNYLTKGVATKIEIISILGKPDLARDKYIIYLRKEYDAGTLYFTTTSGRPVVGEEYMDLYFVFDDSGILIDYEIYKYDERLRPIKDDDA